MFCAARIPFLSRVSGEEKKDLTQRRKDAKIGKAQPMDRFSPGTGPVDDKRFLLISGFIEDFGGIRMKARVLWSGSY
jgi:hypothetical protein